MSTLRTVTNTMTEIGFTAQNAYADPYNDVELDIEFKCVDDGSEVIVPAFWAGGDLWKVRFAPPKAGEWHYRSVCSNMDDSGLCGQAGTISATQYDGDNPLLRHGRLRVATNDRYLEHKDGTPFLWIGDTWWMGLTTRLNWPAGFQELTTDRVAKGFSVVQIITGPLPDMDATDRRGRNEAGLPFEDGFDRINSEYYDHADLKIAHLVQNGLMPCIVGMWGYYLPQIGVERIKRFWRYIVARYGAYPVCWCACGEAGMAYYLSDDKKGEERQQVEGWTEITRYIREVDGMHNPITIHPTQFGRQQVTDPGVIDFEMLQTGHGGYGSIINTVETVRKAYAETPAMPTFVSEVNYEGILGRSHQDVQRMSYWMSVLSGAFGFTYGANGIWQMSTEDDPYGPSPHGRSWGSATWREAYGFLGSLQVSFGRKVFDSIAWWELEPHNEWIEKAWDGTDYDGNIAAGIPGRLRVVYIPQTWDVPRVLEIEADVSYTAWWFDPMTGERTDIGTVEPESDRTWTAPHPVVVHDWVLVMEAEETDR
jgi:hypothetical protein